MPFGVHQTIEYLLGALAFLSIARVEPRSAPLCAGAGALFVVLAALSGGRVGVARAIGPRLHRVLDYAAAVALATSPWWSRVGWGAGGTWIVEALAVVLVWLSRATVYRRAPAPEAPATSRGPSTTGRGLAATARGAGRLAGAVGRKGPRAAGVAVGRIKKRRG